MYFERRCHHARHLGPSINRQKYKVMCLALFQRTTAYKIGSEHTRNYTKLFPVDKVEVLLVIVNKVEVLSYFY